MEGTGFKKAELYKNHFELQLNKYETAPNFIQLSQNLTFDGLLIDFCVFAGCAHKIVLF